MGQVFRIVRRRTIRGRVSEEVAYGITSLTPERADPGRLLELARGHWAIENSLHHARDVTLGEDACRVRTGSAPHLLAAVRNLAVTLARRINATNLAQSTRRFAALPHLAVQSLVLPLD